MLQLQETKINTYADLYRQGVDFHGHGGPFLAVGIRMGIFAVETLHAKGWFDISTKLNLRWAPPDSCIIDGIQISTGCTMGKHNIDVEPGVGATGIFTKDTTQLEIKLKADVFETIKSILGKGNTIEIATLTSSLEKMEINQLFDVTILN